MWTRILLLTLALLSCSFEDLGVSGISSIHRDPKLSVNNKGDILIVWNTGGAIGGTVEYSLNTAAPSPIKGMNVSSQYVTAVINDKQEALTLWNTVTGAIQYSIYDSRTHTMGSVKSVLGVTPYSTSPSLALNNHGDGIGAWFDADQNIQYTSYHRIDQSFKKAQILPGAKTNQDLQVQLNDQGDGILVWYDSVAQLLSYAVYSQDSHFGAVKTLPNTTDALNQTFVLNNKGDAILAWNTGSQMTPSGFLQYSVYNRESKSFGALRTIPSSKEGLAQNAMPQLALNDRGEGVIIWFELNATGKHPILYAQYKQSTKKFENPKVIPDVAVYSIAPQVAINNQGDMLAAWFSTQTGAIQYSMYNKTTKGFSPVMSIPGTEATDQYPQIAINEEGDAFMVWGALGAIKYSLYNKSAKKFNEPKSIIPPMKP